MNPVSPRTIAGLTCLASVWAFAWNLWAWIHLPKPWRTIHLVATLYAAFYIAAWGWLWLGEHVDRRAWSETVAPVAMSSYLIVWSGWAILAWIAHRKGGRL